MIKNIIKGRLLALAQFTIIIFISFLSYFSENISTGISKIAGIILFTVGLFLGLVSIINFHQIITPNPVPLENSYLITTGLYKYIRHPMYLAVMITVLGWCIYFLSLTSIIVVFILIIFFIYKIRFEESNLVKKFPSYSEYKKRTYRFIPYLF